MEFFFETVYDQKTLTTMAKGLRKTLRKKHSRRSHVFGWLVAALSVLLVLRSGTFDFRAAVTLLAALVILIALLFEDWLNGYFARRRMLPGTDKVSSHFTEESFHSATAVGNTEFYYSNIQALAETKDYFIFLFHLNHAQVYDKRTLTGGTAEDFRSFIQDKTKLRIQSV